MLKLLLPTLAIVACALLFMAVNIIVRKGGTFRMQHIGQNKKLRRHGIHCVQSMDAIARKAVPHRVAKMEKGDISDEQQQ